MINILVLLDDDNKIQRFEKVFDNTSNYNFNFFSKVDQAVEFVRFNKVDVSFISVGISIMDGAEASELIFDCNPNSKFVFVFTERNIDKALELFNCYDGCKLINVKNIDYNNVCSLISAFEDVIHAEETYDAELNSFREKENVYKKKLLEISSILNSRLSCYRNVFKLYVASAVNLSNTIKANDVVEQYFNGLFSSYLGLFLDRKVDPDSYYSDLIIKNNDDSKRLLNIKSYPSSDYPDFGEGTFLITMICDFFGIFAAAYRGKVEITFKNPGMIIDLIYDLRFSNIDENILSFFNNMFKEIADRFCDNTIIVNKNGITQYRFLLSGNSACTGK